MSTKDRYDILSKESKSLNEKNDCAVKAVALVCNISYQESHELLSQHGRKNCAATPFSITEKAIKSKNVRLIEVNRTYFISRYPKFGSTTITSKHPKVYPDVWKDGKMYLCRSSGHIFVINDGVTCDWSHDRNLRIKHIYEVHAQ